MTTDTQTNPWVKKGSAIACAILVVAIAYVLVRIVYLFVDSSVGSAPSVYGGGSSIGVPSSAGSGNSKVDTSAIALWNLFGKEGEQPSQAQQAKNVDAPETRLALELQAVFVSPNEERSSAMIAEARKDSLLYRVGDKVPGNVTLEAVFPDKVLLNRNGSLEALFFPENAGAGMSRADSGARGRDIRNSSLMRRSSSSTARRAFGATNGASPAASGMQSAMAGQMVGAIREQLNEDPSQVLNQFGLASNNGRGYVVSESGNPMLAAAGARPGDVILAVNGRSLGDPQQDISLIEDVMQEGSVRISLERNGRAFESEFQLPGR